jgi:hypothetical protein
MVTTVQTVRQALTALALAGATLGATAQTWSAGTLPENGQIQGAPGTRIGWGYEIENADSSLWLVLTAISADALSQATGESLFDLPIVAPGAMVSVSFVGDQGLFALTWGAAAPIGFVNAGSFTLSAEWWNGDPLQGGGFVGLAADTSLPFSATVVAVPEAPAACLLLCGLGVLALRQCARRGGGAVPASDGISARA